MKIPNWLDALLWYYSRSYRSRQMAKRVYFEQTPRGTERCICTYGVDEPRTDCWQCGGTGWRQKETTR